MKKILLYVMLVTTSVSQAFAAANRKQPIDSKMESSFSYVAPRGTVALGPFFLLPLAGCGIGKRVMMGSRSSVDFGLNIDSLIYINCIGLYGNYLFYVNKNTFSQYYIGAGASSGSVFCATDFIGYYLGPAFTVGKEFLTVEGGKRFFQLETKMHITFCGSDKFDSFAGPLMITLSYGIAF